MSKFNIALNQTEIASQIADLLNSGRQLMRQMTSRIILCSNISYIIELEGDKVVGVIGIEKKTDRVSELKHLCVHPDKRRQGLGLKLLKCAMNSAGTEIVYGNVSIDNTTNIRNNLRLGMMPVCRHASRQKTIITFTRRMSGDQTQSH